MGLEDAIYARAIPWGGDGSVSLEVSAGPLGLRGIRLVDAPAREDCLSGVPPRGAARGRGRPGTEGALAAARDHVELFARELASYLAGDPRGFTVARDIDRMGTPFQRRVWGLLGRIPRGSAKSYLEIARELGLPGGARAVGGAVGRNPLPIVIPCHRVVGARGTLGGFSGGLEWKVRLLAIEGLSLDSRGRLLSFPKAS